MLSHLYPFRRRPFSYRGASFAVGVSEAAQVFGRSPSYFRVQVAGLQLIRGSPSTWPLVTSGDLLRGSGLLLVMPAEDTDLVSDRSGEGFEGRGGVVALTPDDRLAVVATGSDRRIQRE